MHPVLAVVAKNLSDAAANNRFADKSGMMCSALFPKESLIKSAIPVAHGCATKINDCKPLIL